MGWVQIPGRPPPALSRPAPTGLGRGERDDLDIGDLGGEPSGWYREVGRDPVIRTCIRQPRRRRSMGSMYLGFVSTSDTKIARSWTWGSVVSARVAAAGRSDGALGKVRRFCRDPVLWRLVGRCVDGW